MRVWQMLPSLSAGDGVGNEVLAMDSLIRDAGYETGIYADYIAPNVPQGRAVKVDKIPDFDRDDILIYHLSIGSRLNLMLADVKCRIIFRYHNITPAAYFAGYNPAVEKRCREGLWQIRSLAHVPYRVLAVSAYNKAHLESLGYQCPIDVLPILIPMEDYKRQPDQAFTERLRSGDLYNILFVGRVSPNKKHEDLIRAFAYYYKTMNKDARLILAGGFEGMELYRRELSDYARLLGLAGNRVVFTGSIRFEQILACYETADLFWCMSEHEGFCIPLVEAMLFRLPILARDMAAVSGTLGQGGILMEDSDPVRWGQQTELIRQGGGISRELLEGQRRQLERYQYDSIKKRLLQILEENS